MQLMICHIELFNISDCKSIARFQKGNKQQTSPCNQDLKSRTGNQDFVVLNVATLSVNINKGTQM